MKPSHTMSVAALCTYVFGSDPDIASTYERARIVQAALAYGRIGLARETDFEEERVPLLSFMELADLDQKQFNFEVRGRSPLESHLRFISRAPTMEELLWPTRRARIPRDPKGN